MGANFSRVKTWSSTEKVVYSDLNAEFDNILNNLTPSGVDDYSASVSQMQSTTDPGEVGTESLATSLAGEIQRLRKLIVEITGEDQWYESPVSSLLGLSNAIGTGLTDNRLVSGRVKSSGVNDAPIFLVPNGAAATVSVKGSTTNFVYYVDGVEYTISTDVSLAGLTAAPAANNTCLINDAQATADPGYTKFTGEDGSIIPVDNMGSEISALVGKFAGFKLAGASTEYFIGYVESSTAISKCFRGYFFDSSDAISARSAYTDNDTITLMKLTWVFAKTDGTLTATYNNPVWSKDQPSSPSLGDYWFDLANNTWKVYGVGSYSAANAHLIGVCIQDTSNCVGARSFEFFANYTSQNTYELVYDTAAQVISNFPNAVANVWGSIIKAERGIRSWNMSTDLDSGVVEGASTYYYAYLTNSGDVIISDVKPYDRREDLQGYYHPAASWRCIGSFFNGSGSDIDANSVNSYTTRYSAKPFIEAAASYHVSVEDKVVRLSGATATHYLPPAAKMKGQELIIIHAGTSLTQVYTLTAFGSETFSSNSATTFLMHTNGQTVKLYSDGVGWIVLSHYTETKPVSYTPSNTQGLGTITITNANDVTWSRHGSFLFLQCSFISGTTAASEAQWQLPSSIVISSTLVPANRMANGKWMRAQATGSVNKQGVMLMTGGNAYLQFGVDDFNAGSSPFASQLGSSIIANTQAVSFFASVPITAWEP